MRIAVLQLNPTIGNLQSQIDTLLQSLQRASEQGAQLAIAPELALCGYPPRDLLDRPGFINDCLAALRSLQQQVGSTALLLGCVVSSEGDPTVASARISNGAVLLQGGKILACHRKILLPTYDVFDEARYFTPGTDATLVAFGDTRLGISVCEDAWNDKNYWQTPRYARDPIAEQVAAGAELLVNLSASPYDQNKPKVRQQMLHALATYHQRPVVYVNQVGGNDALIFDGRSQVLNAQGQTLFSGAAFVAEQNIVDLASPAISSTAATPTWQEDVIEALTLGIRDYTHKCGFKQVVLGLSGGIDSAVVAALAVRALGKDNVRGITMPSRYSSPGSYEDAFELANNLGIRCDKLSIEPIFNSYLQTLAQPFAGLAPDVAEENLQARIRGTLLMAYANKFSSMLLSTGNKSELAVGYCTLYGDMNGALAPIADLYKTEVYGIAQALNQMATGTPPIPHNSLVKAPSAELRPDQKDQDSLPPYDELDIILRNFIDLSKSRAEVMQMGFAPALVERIAKLLQLSEYKRRQAAPGLRISGKAFGEGRRMPIAQSSP